MATQPNLVNKCKLCNLIHTDKDLWTDVHKKILNEGLKRTHVCKWLNKRIEVLNANRTPSQPEIVAFNVSNFTIHFKKHVSSTKQMKAELRVAVKEAPRANDGFTPDEQEVASAVTDAEQEELVASYKDYPATVASMEALILKDLQSGDSIADSHGKVKPGAAERSLRTLQSLIGIKRSLAEVQRTEQVGGSAVRHAMVRIGEEVVAASNKLAAELKVTLVQQLPGSSLPSEVEAMITSRIVEAIKSVYPEILAEVYKLYGIK